MIADHGDPWQLDATLDRIFKIAQSLKAILLIDEADAFMETRLVHHNIHNRIVSIFLRKLEYFPGIIFLTTNRETEFDEAIRSRINWAIEYPALAATSRREIWKSFLSKAHTPCGSAVITPDDLADLQSIELSGREASHIIVSTRAGTS